MQSSHYLAFAFVISISLNQTVFFSIIYFTVLLTYFGSLSLNSTIGMKLSVILRMIWLEIANFLFTVKFENALSYIRSQNAWQRYVYAINQCVLQLIMIYIRSWNAWHSCIYIPLISAYCSWGWLILEVETSDKGVYVYHWSVRIAADDDLY